VGVAVYFCWLSFNKKVMITMDKYGLKYKKSFIRWHNIKDVIEHNVNGVQKSLKIRSSTQSDIVIETQVLDISGNELRSLIYLFKEKFK
jgi:hypothetical protein